MKNLQKHGEKVKMFDYYISLGASCFMAMSMSKYGLRSFSGPFDWLITSDFSWVLHYIETDFKDFLLQENLERFDDNFNHFRDKESGIKFIHDESFEREYYRLKDKYIRRINNFLNKSEAKVYYLRSVQSKEDVEYIMNNTSYIKRVVSKYNIKSEIVFLVSKDLTIPNVFEFRYYVIPGNIPCGASRGDFCSQFDHANDFLEFCGKNYSAENIIKNLGFAFKKEELHLRLVERRYKTLSTLLAHDFCNDIVFDKVIIYGAGVIGKELFKKIKNYTSVIYFVDEKEAGKEFEDIKIILPDEIMNQNNAKIIITAAYDYENIKIKLLDKFQNEDIISLDDMLNLKF